MNNGYNDHKLKMESFFHFFERDGKKYKGIKYTNKNDVDAITFGFRSLLAEDPYEFQQIQIPAKANEIPIALSVNEELKLVSEIEEESKVLIVMAGTSIYEKTLYVFHNDWLMCSLEENNLFVVDENHINLWKESTEE